MDALLDACLDHAAGTPGAAAIWRVWDAAVGPQIARRAQPVRLRGRTLLVAVSSTPWMQELQLIKRAMRDQLNAHLPAPLVDDLRFTLTEHRELAAPIVAPTPPRTPAHCDPPPAAADLGALPEDLRRSLTDVLAAWRRRAWS